MTTLTRYAVDAEVTDLLNRDIPASQLPDRFGLTWWTLNRMASWDVAWRMWLSLSSEVRTDLARIELDRQIAGLQQQIAQLEGRPA